VRKLHGSIISFVTLVIFIINLLPVYAVETGEEFTDTSSMSDEEFFGVWDSETKQWTTIGKINYDYRDNENLRQVKESAKNGDYESAKEFLKEYFAERNADTDPKVSNVSTPTANDIANAELLKEGIFNVGSREIYLASLTMDDNECKNYTMDVTDAVSGSKSVSFILMGRNKEQAVAQFYSKENKDNADKQPALMIKTADNTQHTVYASKDTYVRAGDYSNKNYGGEPLLLVNDSGAPVDDNTYRSYIQFDFSGVSGTITSAVLSLWGKVDSTEPVNKEIMLFKYNNTAWKENDLTFSTINTMVYSWKGVEGGNDWSIPAGADAEYINNLTRFNFVAALVGAHLAEPEGLYDYTLLNLVLDFINDRPASYPRRLETGMRVCDFITAFHYMRSNKYFNGNACTAMLKSIWEHGNYLNEKMTPDSNWGVTETLGLYWVALYFPEFYDSSVWESSVGTRCKNLLEGLLYDDFSYKEPSTHYAGVAFKDFINMVNWANLQNRPAPKELAPYLLGYARFFVDSCFPNDYQTQYGDSDYVERRSTIRPIGRLLNDEQLIYYGSSTKRDSEGNPLPAPKVESVYYPDGKIAVLRTGMTSDSLYMHINNKNYGNHGHPGALGIIAYAYGRPLLIDPGRGSYSNTDLASKWLRESTEAHNTIEINDTAQRRTDNLDPSGLITNPGFDLYEGTTTETEGFEHTRYVFFMKPSFWVVSDIVIPSPSKEDNQNKYQQTWHMLPNADITLDEETAKARSNFNDEIGSNIHIVPADPEKLASEILDGYYSPKENSVENAKYVSYTQQISGTVNFDTLLYPVPKGVTAEPTVSRIDTGVEPHVATALEIKTDKDSPSGYYYLSYEETPTERTFADFSYDGKMVFVQTADDGNVKMVCMVEGSELKTDSNLLVQTSVPVKDLQIQWKENGVHLESNYLKSADGPVEIFIDAPETDAVYVNGQPASFIRSGDHVCVYLNTIGVQWDEKKATVSTTYIRKSAGRPAQPVLCVAFYKMVENVKELIGVRWVSSEDALEVGESAPLYMEIDIPEDVDVIQAFLWDSMNGMKPVYNNITTVPRY